METPDRFKNSPIHDKGAILELMDELKPEQMAELVDYLQKRVKLFPQPLVSGSLLSDLDYWKQRCLLAEKCLEESPCDPDITTDQIKAWNAYHKFISWAGKCPITK